MQERLLLFVTVLGAASTPRQAVTPWWSLSRIPTGTAPQLEAAQ